MSIQLDHEEGTDQPHGESTWFLRSCSARCVLNITRVRHFCTVFAAQAEAMYKPKSSSHCCLLCVRCAKLRKSRIKNLSHRLFHMLNLFRCSSFHLCPTTMTTSSGAICLYLVSRERGLQKLHSFVAPTMLPRRDLLRLAMRAD